MPEDPAFLAIGHRGARGHAPENTLLAIDTGIRLGADMVEFDVRRHGDALLVIHDSRLDRTTNGTGRLDRNTLDYIRSVDAGKGQQVPLLHEVLDLVEARVPVNIEMKSAEGTATLVAGIVRDYIGEGWAPSHFLVSSFHLPELYEFKQLMPDVPIGALLAGVPLDWAAIASELSAQVLNISAEFADPRLVQDAHARGLRVYAYTVNFPDDMRDLRELGLDGVFSDYPERVLTCVSEPQLRP